MSILYGNDIRNYMHIKVLAIGNSFSVDAVEYLYKIAKNCGIQTVIIGNLAIDGATLEGHYHNLENNLPNYNFYYNKSDYWELIPNVTMKAGLLKEQWDMIILQQVSGYSGIPGTYEPFLQNLINYIKRHKTRPDTKIGWHLTWAYQQTSNHHHFNNYQNNQMTMYKAIVNAVKTKVVSTPDINIIIPAGTTIQNLRTSYLGDTLTRDGYHLSLDKGRYAAGLTWFKTITDANIAGIDYKPLGVSAADLSIIKAAVNNAYLNPYRITPFNE